MRLTLWIDTINKVIVAEIVKERSEVSLNLAVDGDSNLPLFVVKFVVPSMGASIVV